MPSLGGARLKGRSLLQRIAYAAVNSRFKAAETILLTSSPRSGSTWVGSMLAAARGVCLMIEPLRLNVPGVREAGCSWRTYVDQEREWPEGRALLERIVCGDLWTPTMLIDIDLPEDIERVLVTPSRETGAWPANHNSGSAFERLAPWKNQLTRDDVDAVFEVVDRVGFTGYDQTGQRGAPGVREGRYA